MQLSMLKGKIHRATVTQAELNYVGSITVDEDLLDKAGILEYEKVQIVNINNGERFETYIIKGERGSGSCRKMCQHRRQNNYYVLCFNDTRRSRKTQSESSVCR